MRVTGMDATYYTVINVNDMTRFYADLLGTEPAMTWPGRLAEWTFDDGNSFGLYGSESEGMEPGGNGSVMFAVADVGKAVDEAKSRGVTFHQGGEITDTPSCHMAFGEDPEGNQFILHMRKSG
jgi:predicted enzyme related to lactoylglutathione lyase